MNINDIFKNMPAIQDMALKANENMKNIKATGEAAAGMVRVTVNGAHELLDIEIDDEMMKPSEKKALITLIKGAHNVASKRVAELLKENLFNLAKDVNPDQITPKK